MSLTQRTKVLIALLLWLVAVALFLGWLCSIDSPWSWI